MSTSGEELVRIFKKVKTRIKQGTKNYDLLTKIFSQRAEFEDKFASSLKGLIPSDADKEDALLQSVIGEIHTEVEIHQKFAAEIRSKVSNPMEKEDKQIKDHSKQILTEMKKSSHPIKKAVLDAQKTQKQLEEANNLLNTLPPAKKDAQNKKITKITVELNQKIQKANQLSDQIKGTAVPKIHAQFSKFDSDRLSSMQNYTVKFVSNKKVYMGQVIEGCSSLTTRATSFDASDRSERYLNNVFDTKAGDGSDDKNLMVIAIADYRSDDPHDLSFRRGDRIHVLLTHNTGWWEGQLENGTTGVFPRTYVEQENQIRGLPIPIDAIFNVYEDFNPTQQGQIPLLNGDFAFVDVLQRDGFCRGINLRTNQKGLFPLSALEHDSQIGAVTDNNEQQPNQQGQPQNRQSMPPQNRPPPNQPQNRPPPNQPQNRQSVPPPQNRQGGIPPPQNRQGGIPPPQNRQSVPPPQNRQSVPPPQNRQGGIPPPQNYQGGIPPPQNRQGGIPPPQNRQGGIPPPQNRQGGIPPPQNRQSIPPPQGRQMIPPPQARPPSMGRK